MKWKWPWRLNQTSWTNFRSVIMQVVDRYKTFSRSEISHICRIWNSHNHISTTHMLLKLHKIIKVMMSFAMEIHDAHHGNPWCLSWKSTMLVMEIHETSHWNPCYLAWKSKIVFIDFHDASHGNRWYMSWKSTVPVIHTYTTHTSQAADLFPMVQTTLAKIGFTVMSCLVESGSHDAPPALTHLCDRWESVL